MPTNSERVPAVERTMRILALLAQAQRPLSCSEISLRLKIPRTSTHMIVKTLEAHMFVEKVSARGYQLGRALLSFGRSRPVELKVPEQVSPWLMQLAARTRLPVRFAVLDEDRVAVVASVDAAGAFFPQTAVSAIHPWTSPLGRCLLAGMSESALERLADVTAGGQDRSALIVSVLEELQTVRSQGFTAGAESQGSALITVAAPVMLREKAVAAVAVTGPAKELRSARLDFVGGETARTAEQLAAHLGRYSPHAIQRISATGVP